MSHHHTGETAASVTTRAWLHDSDQEGQMSYDVSYEVTLPDGTTTGFGWRNYTSNCAPMWRRAGCDIAEFDGRTVTEFASALALAVAAMEADMGTYRAMNPANGGGDADDMLETFLRPLLRGARAAHPAAIVRVSR
jgi:hypothetical protein